MTCIICRLVTKTFPIILTSLKIILHRISLHRQMFIFSISLSLPYGLYIAIILVSCALCLCPSSPRPSPSTHPLPACMLRLSCACSSIFIVAFYVSRDCSVTSLPVHSIAFIHTLTR